MTSGHDHKWIRSIKDNPSGKVVADPEGNRWEWERADKDETARLLEKLHNPDLAIEQTDIVQNPPAGLDRAATRGDKPRITKPLKKTNVRDAGGGFNPYDHPGKPRRR
jgi:hypothetical protein